MSEMALEALRAEVVNVATHQCDASAHRVDGYLGAV
jgi:hypothetical protein